MRILVLAVSFLATACDLADPGPEADLTHLAGGDPRECATICDPRLGGCHRFCAPIEPELSEIEVVGDTSCDRLRPINVCGDGCCDQEEVVFGAAECRPDCVLKRLEWRLELEQAVGFLDGVPFGSLVEGGVRLQCKQ